MVGSQTSPAPADPLPLSCLLWHTSLPRLCDTEEPLEVDEVCGCNCGCAALSATCWLEVTLPPPLVTFACLCCVPRPSPPLDTRVLLRTQRLLGKPDTLLETKLRAHPKLPTICKDLLHVVSRRDGNPFSLTRLLYVPDVFAWLVETQPGLASEALCFLTFGLLHFDNPMFSEDAVQALQALLREPGVDVEQVLGHRASLPLLEALSTCACYSPSAISVLESVASSAGGRTSLYSLATALSVNPAARADGTGGDGGRVGGASGAPPEDDEAMGATGDADDAESDEDGADTSARLSGSAAFDAAADGADSPDAETASSAASNYDSAPSLNGRGSGGERRSSSSRNGSGGGLLVRVLHEAGALAAKLRAVWPAHRLTAQARGGAGTPRPGSAGAGDALAESAGPAAALVAGAGAAGGAEDSEGEDGDEVGEARTQAHEHSHDDGELPGGVEAWDRFVAELPRVTAMTLAGLTTAPLDWGGASAAAAGPAAAEQEVALAPGADAGAVGTDVAGCGDDASPAAADAGAEATSPPSASNAGAAEGDGADRSPDVLAVPSATDGGGGAAASSSQDSALPGAAPLWPNLLVQGDVVKAWVLLELVGFQPGQEEELLARMTLSDKRVWLSRRLYREHHGGRMSEEDAILFIECTRDDKKGAILSEMRAHYADGVGLAADLSGTLEVHFKEENSAGSAVKREWFALASDALVATEAGVLVSPDRGCTFRPRPVAPGAREEVKARQLLDLELLGRLLGLALLQQATVGFRLHASVCKLLLRNGEPWEWSHDDVRALDPQLYQHKVDYVLNHDVEMLCLDFTDVVHDVQAGELGEREGGTSSYSEERVALLPGGEDMEVTEQNKEQFVQLVCAWRLFGSIEAQVRALCRGFQAAVPPAILTQLAALISPDDLATILAGEASIDVVDWEANTQCAGGMRRKDRTFRWFWRAVRSFTPGEHEQLLQFVTGSRRPPAGGFAQLQGFNGGVHKFTLCLSDLPIDSLPRAHACTQPRVEMGCAGVQSWPGAAARSSCPAPHSGSPTTPLASSTQASAR